MDESESGPWSAPGARMDPAAAQREAEPGRPRGGKIWRATKTGVRLSLYVGVPLAYVFGLVFAVPTMIGLGAGRGFGISRSLLGAAAIVPVLAFYGALIGGFVGVVGSLIPRRWRTSRGLDRPVRLRFWRMPAADAPAGPRRRPRWPWVLGGLAWLVLLTALGVGFALGRLVDRRLGSALAAAERDDPNWAIDDLMAHREDVPDEENAALVVDDVVRMISQDWPGSPREPSEPPDPAEEELKAAFDRALAKPAFARIDAVAADMLHRELETHAEAVKLGRSLADLHRGRHELELGPTLLDTPLPQSQGARAAARLMEVDALLRAHDGDLDGALDSCRAGLGVARSIGDEPFAIGQLVRVACGVLALKATECVLAQDEPSDEALARL